MTTITTSTSGSDSAAVPLTTVFTPPASCSSLHWVSSKCLESTCKGIYNIVAATDSDCYPSGWATSATGFSPGLSCPANWSVGTSNVVVLGVGATETHATCCPTGYTVAKSSPQVWYTPEPCMSISKGTTIIDYTVVGVTPSSTTRVTYKNPIVHAYPVGLTYRSTDSASPSTSPPSTSPPSASATATAADAAAAGTSSGGLSTGAKAGIGVGVAVAGLIIIVLGCFMFLRSRKNQKGAAQATAVAPAPAPAPGPGPGPGPGQASAPTSYSPGPNPSPTPGTIPTSYYATAAAAPPAWSELGHARSGSMTKETEKQEYMTLPQQRGFRAAELPGSNPHVAELDSSGEPPLPPLPSDSPHSPHSQHSHHLPYSPHSTHSTNHF
ncbi:hypothetical protein N7492_005619 [Penicillium capsulatum]|uniref:Uncharacterized protein n=1 Tax=Penicillium capsulatum TaxID=69766 RepID=A0A9W9ICT1_9EURO|nr:hypothetical protein N7492_005619 [Penicillium capsulatum]KAJ6135283.1 hypothetical protein N7512_000443 [Penicillium capsulatum]